MDFRLDREGDLVLQRGDLAMVSGVEEIAQRLRIRLRLFLGEWFLDEAAGVPYWEQILGSKIGKPALLSIFREQLLACPGVLEVTSIDADMGAGSRDVRLTFTASTEVGDLSDSIEVAP